MKIYCGIYQDGLEFKIAFLKKHKKRIFVLKTLVMPFLSAEPVHDIHSNKLISSDGIIIEDENLNLTSTSLVTLLEHYPIQELNFVPVISEPNIAYLVLNELSLQGGGSFKNLIKKQWESKLNRSVDEDDIDFVEYKNKNIISTYMSGEVQLLNELKNLSQVENVKSLEILPIRSADISLINYFYRFYKPQKLQKYLLLYVGTDSLRVIFISDGNVVHINDYLSIGTQRNEMIKFIASKVAFEMEIAGISTLTGIIVTGDITADLVSSLKQSFPFVKVEPLNLSVFKFDENDENMISTIQSYAFSLLAVLDTLDSYPEIKHDLRIHSKKVSKLSIFQKFDFLSFFGFMVILMIIHFSITVYEKNKIVVNELKFKYDQLSRSANNQSIDYSKLNFLNSEFDVLYRYSNLLEKISDVQITYSQLMEKINSFNPIKNNIWLTDLITNDSKESILVLKGLAINRTKIPEFSKIFSKAEIKSIYLYEIRGKKIFQFEINIAKI